MEASKLHCPTRMSRELDWRVLLHEQVVESEKVLRVGLEALRSQDDRNRSSGTKDGASRAYY